MTAGNRARSLMAAILCGLLAAQFMEAGTAHALPATVTSAVRASAGSAGNLWVLAMEITQATQPWLAVNRQTKSLMPIEIDYSPDAMPLVRGKRTVVRVYPGLEGPRPGYDRGRGCIELPFVAQDALRWPGSDRRPSPLSQSIRLMATTPRCSSSTPRAPGTSCCLRPGQPSLHRSA